MYFLKCELAGFLKPYKLNQRLTFKNHFPSHNCLLAHRNKWFVPLALATDLQNPGCRSGCDKTVVDVLAVEGNKWYQVDVNSLFTRAVVHSPALELLESTSHYVALKSCFPG